MYAEKGSGSGQAEKKTKLAYKQTGMYVLS